MLKSLVVVAAVVVGTVSAQETGIQEEHTPLPAPYRDSTGKTVERQPVETGRTVSPQVKIYESQSMVPGNSMQSIRANAHRGLGTYIAGFVLEYGVAVPLSLIGLSNYEEGPILGAAIVELVSTGFVMAGPIRAGVAASEAYDYSHSVGIDMEKNSNWGYYKAGWVLKVVGALCNMITQVGGVDGGMDMGTAQTLSIISLSSTIVSDALWMTSVINAAKYTRMVAESTRRSSLSLYPVYSYTTGAAGLGMQLRF